MKELDDIAEEAEQNWRDCRMTVKEAARSAIDKAISARDARIAELERESIKREARIQLVEGNNKFLTVKRDEAEASAESLQAQLAAAQKDAERYQKVKTMTWNHLREIKERTKLLSYGGQTFDAAIDAAQNEAKGE